jgi:acyl-CoA hydrolase
MNRSKALLLTSTIAAMLLLGGASFAVAAEALNLSPSMKVGDQMSLDLVLTESVETSVVVDGEIVASRKEEARLALIGDFEVLAVDEWQRPTKRRVVVQLLVSGHDEDQEELLDSGTAVFISQGTESSAAIGTTGDSLPPEADRALRALFDAWSVLGVDAIFGTDRPSGEQGRWPVRPDKALEALGLADSAMIDAEGIRGEVRVTGRDQIDGIPCTRSQLSLEFPIAQTDGPSGPDGTMTIATKQDDCRPIGGAPSPRRQHERYVTLIEVEGPDGAKQVTRQERSLQTQLRRGHRKGASQAQML